MLVEHFYDSQQDTVRVSTVMVSRVAFSVISVDEIILIVYSYHNQHRTLLGPSLP